MKNYVGRKIKGFRFEDRTDGVYWSEDMKGYIGVVGEIVSLYNLVVTVSFNNASWGYPASLVEKHLVEDEITLLEALCIVQAGWHGEEQELLYKRCTEILVTEKRKLQSIYIKTTPKYTHAELVEKLGYDFEYEK
jgi:hypothetical protein